MDKKPLIEIIYFDAGGGHRSAMNALSSILAERHPDWTIKATNLQALLEPIDPVYRVTDKLSVIREVLDEVKPKLSPMLQRLLENIAPRLTFRTLQSDQFYNELLKRGVRSGLDILLPILQRLIRLSSGKIIKILTQHWQSAQQPPDLLISVIPNFNSVMFRALKKLYPQTPYVTIMTDMVDIPPHFWMEEQDQIMICGTQKAYNQAISSGFYRAGNIHYVSGMILKPFFYDAPPTNPVTLASLGLSSAAKMRTALVMFGGNGSALSRHIVDQLNLSDLDVQSIVMCGNNRELYDSLLGVPRCCPVPFVANVAPYLRLADFMIGKPGPGSISEAVHMGCPVLVEGNATTMPQERPNIDWILENGVGATVKNFTSDTIDGARRMIDNLETYATNIRNMPQNRALFEIADILENILENTAMAADETVTSLSARKTRLRRLAIRARGMQKKLLKRTRRV